MTTLEQKQFIFSRYLALLLDEFPDHCFQLGETWRSPETCALYAKEGKGVIHSCHQFRLAIDLNIWVEGEPSKDKRDYQKVGDFWKDLPVLYPEAIEVETCWGGDFTSLCDFFHFSIAHNGVR